MAAASLRLASASNGSAWMDMLYDDVSMTCTGVQWSNPFRLGSATIWDPTGVLLFDGTPIGAGSVNLRKNQTFSINLTSDPPVLPAFAFGIVA